MKKIEQTGWTSANKTNKVQTKHETIELKETKSPLLVWPWQPV
jgi:hypothetical protein